ncbi:hypothetical protein [Hymenobacter cavernae]|uniref:T9SS C-terminal target domain-containing protein n=1 Tax=Hymenobacter cavernae TaxID=2044852 RepID=A0ABQ1TQU8_9BACT|nr:hypothetical protein [Hymenobacter cavernae]GGE99006.1 hypothetical protein GCM10011383_07290 [Hymenobacter cavernae]
MKKNTFSLALVASLMLGLAACQKDAVTPAPNVVGSGDNTPTTPVSQLPTTTVEGNITANTTWSASNRYLLKGFVYVAEGVTLTIEPGTVIKGDKDTKGTLVIKPGAKIMAMGTAQKPIIFTSNQSKGARNYGDWGGVVLAGKAPANNIVDGKLPTVEGGIQSSYAGQDPADNSGTLQYVRIEFGGVALSPGSEINGLTMAGIGSGTTIDHIQVSYSGDDAYEWFGGTVNAKYLVAHRTWDDDFDTDNGFSGKVQFAVSLRDPQTADQSGSKAFESDNDNRASDALPRTAPVFSNITAVGPLINPTGVGSISTQYIAGAHIRRNSSISIMNSVLMGYPTAVLVDNAKTAANIASGGVQFKNNIIAGTPTGSNSVGGQRNIIFIGGSGGPGDLTPNNSMSADSAVWGSAVGPLTWLKASANASRQYATADAVRLTNAFSLMAPSFVPLTQSPIVYTSADKPTTPVVPGDFSSAKLTDAFFTKVGYIGAFSGNSSENWLAGWTNFDPQNTDY